MSVHPANQAFAGLQRVVAQCEQRGRTALFMRRVDAHLADKTVGECLTFLRDQLNAWERRYRVWQRAVDRGDDIGSDASACDYAQTIAALATKIGQIEAAQ
jgi:hypothetical protein